MKDGRLNERFTKDVSTIKFSSFLVLYCPNISVGFLVATTQPCLITLIEKWKKCVDNGSAFGALFTDLSKAFICLPHELLVAKLHAYGQGLMQAVFDIVLLILAP